MSIEAIVKEFSAVAANPKGQLKAYKDAGKKCIGVMPYYCLLYTSPSPRDCS